MLIGARTAAWSGGAKLPYDAEVEWIEATGDQLIVLPFKGSDELVIDIGFSAPSSGFDKFRFFGSRETASSRGLLLGSYDGSWQYDVYLNYGNNSGYLKYIGKDVYKYRWDVHIKNGESYLKRDGVIVYSNSGKVSKFTTPNELLVFGNNTPLGIYKSKGKLYYLKIIGIVDFIPVRFTNENGISEGAMYDRVSGQLFRNQGTGAFIIGPDK